MTTLMQHPQHGRHPATGSEMPQLLASGWTVVPSKRAPEAAQAPEPVSVAVSTFEQLEDEPEAAVQAAETQSPRRPGRPKKMV